jgi:archaemetzincin
MKLVIQPIVVDRQQQQNLEDSLNSITQILPQMFWFNDKLSINPQISQLPPTLFDSSRGQFKSHYILRWLQLNLKPTENTKVLAVCGFDAYFGNCNFCFGQAIIGGRVAAIYLERLVPPPPLPTQVSMDDNKRHRVFFNDRTIKESIHELGHTFGLRYCSLNSCIMFKSKTISDTDRKNREFCSPCFKSLSSLISH